MEEMVYKNKQQAINLLTINITIWRKKKVVENTSQRPDISYDHSGIFNNSE